LEIISPKLEILPDAEVPIVTDKGSNYLFCYTSDNQKIRHAGKQLHFTSNNDVIVHFVRSVYYSDTLELIKLGIYLFNKNYSVLRQEIYVRSEKL